ncbi:hypothetical protein CY35_02G048500 [Sphagnum magellanicum]|nr:hypothetical protein CY35_02G048500 [Sphagnum magellanicum]KAH9570585.1 hypothetical protein CY35_02G048500 [Sphagnum magellanicum]KAH9570586.1 hypothetical protein CY35_02G048500 [Sphagnum magellanicum]
MSPPRRRGKQGPCGHCGIETTPLWRNGPPEKPVLCNACGSRWRTKGTLLNYMPMHSGGFGSAGSKEGVARRKKGSHKRSSDPACSHKRKEPSGGHVEIRTPASLHPLLLKDAEEELKTTSSLESGVFGPDSDALSRSSPVQSDSSAGLGWEGPIPSRKRTPMVRGCTSLEKLISHFQELMNESPPQSCPTATSSESAEELLVEGTPSIMTVEKGVDIEFIQQNPVPLLQEPAVEVMSFLMESAGNVEAMQGMDARFSNGVVVEPLNVAPIFPAQGKEKPIHFLKEMEGMGYLQSDHHLVPNKALLENFAYNKQDVLQGCQSPLVFLEMKEILNFDTYTGLLTDQEKGQLARLVSPVDTNRIPESLKEMFNSGQFEGALVNFQQLLSEGMFDTLEPGMDAGVLEHLQQLLTASDLNSSGWMERLSQLQIYNKHWSGSSDLSKNKELIKDKMNGCRVPLIVGSGSIKNSLDNAVSMDDLPDLQVPGSDGMEPDLLFDLSSNILSFHEAEFLQQPVWTKSKEESESNQIESGGLIMSNIWHMDNSLSELFWNPLCGSPGNGLPNGAVLNPGQMLI